MSKIMVIEEDAAMRMLICEWLAGSGHDVRSLQRHAAQSDGTVDLVILDLPQPRSLGGETARAVRTVRSRYPRAAVVGISAQVGRSLGSGSDAARALGVTLLLAKPCTREELLHAVATAL